MPSWLDVLGEQARAQGLAKRSALFAVLVPIVLLLFALLLEGDVEAYAAPIVVAAAGGLAIHLAFRWLERRGR